MRHLFITLLIITCTISSYSQKTINGTIIDSAGYPVAYAQVCLVNSEKCSYTNQEGGFIIDAKINDSIITRCIGYYESIYRLSKSNETYILKEKSIELDEVILDKKTEKEIHEQEGFSVEIIELKEYENSKPDVNSVLEESSGIVVRQSGGLGSDYNFSLNGLSGKQVKFFIDGIPIDNYGSSFTPNNFPVNLIKNIEVYKGVVPIRLGADALGGAINLVTDGNINKYLNCTYSLGSFNTHRLGLSGQYTHKDYFIRLLSFINYSDNNYVMDDIRVTDELGNILDDVVSVERYHDQYQSKLISVNTGVTLKKWVDRFTVGYSFSNNKNNVQHDLSLLRPYGELQRLNELHTTNLHYEKDGFISSKLDVDLFATGTIQTTSLIDTSTKKYDWFGNYTIQDNENRGETSNNKSVFEFQDKVLLSRLNLNYNLSSSQKIEFNYTQNYLQRRGVDSLNTTIVPFEDPHSLSKHITGISHNWNYAKNKGNSIIFLKGYLVNYNVVSSDFSGNLTDVDQTDKSLGYGIAQSFKINKNWLAKLSFEKAYRIPDAYEIFGNGFTLLSNTDLKAETSNNLNLGIHWKTKNKKFNISASENIFIRRAENFIVVESVGPFARFTNKDKINIFGSETELKLDYKKSVSISTNVTYQNMADSDGYRIANIPYLFGHVNLGYKKPEFIKKGNVLQLFLSTNLRQEFFLISPADGDKAYKNTIPKQSNVDFTITHSFQDNKYQVSATMANIFNQKLYDNFRIQKPGRNFRFLFKYFLK